MDKDLRIVAEALLALYRNAAGAEARQQESRLRTLLQPQREAKVEAPSADLTPYATLLALRGDPDAQIRKLYHAFARQNHPDATQDHSEGPAWALATIAYNAIKTEELRSAFDRTTAVLAGCCARCRGVGTIGTRRFAPGPRLCLECKGRGRQQ